MTPSNENHHMPHERIENCFLLLFHDLLLFPISQQRLEWNNVPQPTPRKREQFIALNEGPCCPVHQCRIRYNLYITPNQIYLKAFNFETDLNLSTKPFLLKSQFNFSVAWISTSQSKLVKVKVKERIVLREIRWPQNYGTPLVNGITVLSATRQRWPPGLHPNRAGWYSIYRPRWDERLSWPSWLVKYRNGLPVHRRSPIRVLTGCDVAQLRWSKPTRYH